MSTPPVVIGDVIAGKYVVERVIGEGGMGVVLAARHLELEQRVAIKFLLPEIAEQGMAAERFRREARAAARIRGQHVCRVLDVGTLENGVPFMVMEYLHGCDLASELEQRGHLPCEEAVGYVLQACEALAEAHAAGVIHRDLKPANLFLEQCADGSRRIKVLDFGVSKSLLDGTRGRGAAALTKTSSLVGSPLYMSPEQLDSAKDVDPRTDIWALGVVLYELIAGCTPFKGESIPQLVTAVLHDPPTPLAAHKITAPAGLEDVMRCALHKPRNERYPSIAEFVFALMPYAPPHAAGTAGRVSRLLSTTELSGPLPIPQLHSATSTPRASIPSEPATPLAWSSDSRRQRRARRLWVGVALVLVVGVGGYLVLRDARDGKGPPPSAAATDRPYQHNQPSQPAAVAARPSQPFVPSQANMPPAAQPSVEDAPVEKPQETAPPSAAALPPQEPPVHSAPKSPVFQGPTPKLAPTTPAAPVTAHPTHEPEPRNPVARTPAKASPPTNSGDGISDFGGRR